MNFDRLTTLLWSLSAPIPFGLVLLIAPMAQGQISLDTSLGRESSIVTTQVNQDLITGGAVRGSSLFHSFQELNVAAGRSLFFSNPAGISQIFSRVTGSNPSNIDGTIGILGNADLFLLNPNGVLFGPNARLDLRGSFTTTTAASVTVGGLEFSAISPSAPPLLDLSVQPGIQWGPIASNSRIRNDGILTVGAGRSLSFLGGQLEQAGTLLAPAGTVTLQGDRLGLTGTVDTRNGPNTTGTLRLVSPGDLQIQTNAPLTAQALNQALLTNGVVVQSDRDLTVRGTLRNQSLHPLTLEAGRDLRYSSDGQYSIVSGDIILTSGREIQLENARLSTQRFGDRPSQIQVKAQQLNLTNSTIGSGTIGSLNGADITVTVAQVITLQGSDISTSTDGAGNAGNVSIRAGGDIVLKAGVVGSYGANSSGNTGSLTLEAQSLRIDDRLQTNASRLRNTTDIVSSGDSGDITIRTTEAVDLLGNQPGSFVAQNLTALRFLELAQTSILISASAFGSGKSGDISITTDWLNLQDGASIGNAPGIFATSLEQSGNVQINARDISLRGRSAIVSVTLGATNAGNVTIQGRDDRPSNLNLTDGAFISTNSLGINPLARSIGNAGELTIEVDQLTVLNGSFLGAGTDSDGSGGTLRVTAEQITVSGTAADGLFPSALRTDVGTGTTMLPGGRQGIASGEGGQIIVKANRLGVLNGGKILASTQSAGNAGNVDIRANWIEVRGTSSQGIPSTVEARSTGTGAAGTLQITGQGLTVDRGAQISTTTQQGNGGNIVLDLRDVLLLRDRGLISATAGQSGTGGDGGNIQVQAGFIVAPLGSNSDITANAFEGNGGEIAIQTEGIFGLEFRPNLTPNNDITASSEFGLNGTVSIDILAFDPTRGFAQLPVDLDNVANQIDSSCDRFSKARSRFVLTGRGGLPPDPRQEWSASGILQDWREMTGSPRLDGERRADRSDSLSKTIEATGWQMGSDNRIRLISAVPNSRINPGKHSCSPLEFGTL